MHKQNILNSTIETQPEDYYLKIHINWIRCKHPPSLAILDKMSYVFFMLLNEDKSST